MPLRQRPSPSPSDPFDEFLSTPSATLRRNARTCETCANPAWREFTEKWLRWAVGHSTAKSARAFEHMAARMGYGLTMAAFYQHMRHMKRDLGLR